MKPPTSIASARRAREAIAEASRLVVMPSPDAAGDAVPRLEAAVTEIEELAAVLRSGAQLDHAGAGAALDEVRSELERLRRVLDYAAAYHAAWARILSSMATGYTPVGAAPLPEPPPRVTVTG